VKAATFGATYVRLDRMAASTATTGIACATTPGADTGTEGKVVVTFPAGFTLSETVADWTVATTDLPNGATAWPSIATATDASDTTKEVTFPSGDLSASTQYCFRWTDPDALTTSGAGNNLLGSIETLTAGDGALDSDSFALAVQDDQIGVTASIAQS